MRCKAQEVARALAIAAVATVAGGASASQPSDLRLGEKIFFDASLSRDGTVSCATCHDPAKAFSDGIPVAKGVQGQSGTRNSPSLLNVAHQTSFFWDGRRGTLEEQVLDPLTNPREHALSSGEEVVARIARNAEYQSLLPEGPLTQQRVASALATYIRGLRQPDSPFDRFWRGESSALTLEQRRGFELFRGRAQCAACHRVEPGRIATFTDNGFHALGLASPSLAEELPEMAARSARASGAELDGLIGSVKPISSLGRFNVTRKPGDIGKFRTPSLREVARTAPYMHDGGIATLEEAVDAEIYYRSVREGRALVLTPQERGYLVSFLRALSSETDATPRESR